MEKNLSSRMIRWALKLSEFNIEWEHRPGVKNVAEVFEHLSHRLDIKHIKTVTYRPQANLTERVNRTLVLMIACFVEGNHDNWDRFLHEFAFALRTSVNEMTGKTPAESFLGRKIITPFSKLINVTEGAEYVGRNIEKLFVEARQNVWKQHKTWGKYYNSKRREVNIKVNDLGLKIPRLKRKVGSNGSVERTDKTWSKICRKRSLPGSEHEDQKRPTPESTQGIKKSVPSSVSSRKHKYRRPNNPSQESQSIVGPSHQIDTRQYKPPTEGSRQGASIQYGRARETRTTPSGGNSAAERRPVRSRQAATVRPCPYYLRSRVKQPEGIPEEQRSNGIDSIPQNNLRRRSLSMEALDGDPLDRCE
ncbi:uncharacterized protein TNCV_3802581 [Trichonephila clavipes]|nr:uncharacterized protein TNCV_3802581 [Trichonephila clavipes]